jgi:radical SAM-linked protein
VSRTPDRPAPPPTIQRLRIRYAKRGRLRFSSHRDFQRALERALRRADVPIAFSAGFTPHPRVSYAGAAPTGAASEAEYFEIGLAEPCDPDRLRLALDESLPPGLDILAVVEASGAALADRLEASHWVIELPGVEPSAAEAAARRFLAADAVEVTRMTKTGLRTFDARAAVVRLTSAGGSLRGAVQPASGAPCAILDLVVRHVTPAVRPDDVLTGLRAVADLVPPMPVQMTRLAQGPLDPQTGDVGDPLSA